MRTAFAVVANGVCGVALALTMPRTPFATPRTPFATPQAAFAMLQIAGGQCHAPKFA